MVASCCPVGDRQATLLHIAGLRGAPDEGERVFWGRSNIFRGCRRRSTAIRRKRYRVLSISFIICSGFTAQEKRDDAGRMIPCPPKKGGGGNGRMIAQVSAWASVAAHSPSNFGRRAAACRRCPGGGQCAADPASGRTDQAIIRSQDGGTQRLRNTLRLVRDVRCGHAVCHPQHGTRRRAWTARLHAEDGRSSRTFSQGVLSSAGGTPRVRVRKRSENPPVFTNNLICLWQREQKGLAKRTKNGNKMPSRFSQGWRVYVLCRS
ncbi:UNVERIFIED_CONTAM: hypothetical protein GTU68_009074 [Idotea baltica]|nr:hypothetical protein [Idotea baltica]